MKSHNTGKGPVDPMPVDAVTHLAGQTGARTVAAAIRHAGEATGAGFDILYNMARRESALDPMAKAKTSSAAGLFQFIDQTWLGAVKNYGAKHGLVAEASAITRTASGKFTVADAMKREEILNLRFDPTKAAALAGELIQENRAGLERRLGRAVNAAELYAAHFLGLGGATKLLTAAPDAKAADLLPKAAAANRPVFFAGSRARAVSEVLESIAKSMGLAVDDAPVATQVASSQPTLETKSAAVTFRPDLQVAAEAIVSRGAAPLERLAAPRIIEPQVEIGMPRSFAMGPQPLMPSLSPLALAILQALDPTRLGAGRNEPRS